MKKAFLVLVAIIGFAFAANAQNLGVRLGTNGEISYQQPLGSLNRLEVDLGVGGLLNWNNTHYFSLTGVYQWHWYIVDKFGWYVGPGAQASYFQSGGDNFFNVSVVGQIGLDYEFSIPLQISLDVRPAWHFLGNVAGFGWGVFGAGLATVLAQAVSAVLCILFVRRRVPILCFSWRDLRVDRALARQTLSYGGITALQQCAQPIGNLVIQGSVNLLGVTAAAAFSAARKIEDIGLLPGRSVSSAITSFTAQNTGAQKYRRTEEGFRKAILLEMACGFLVSSAVLLLRAPLMSLFTADSGVTEEGVRYFSIIGFCYLLPCLTNGLQGYFRGTGRMTVSLLGTLTQISVRVIVTLLAVPQMGIPGVGLACVAGWSAMLLWQIPLRRRIKNRMLSRHPVQN